MEIQLKIEINSPDFLQWNYGFFLQKELCFRNLL